jgi:hypothetical protein
VNSRIFKLFNPLQKPVQITCQSEQILTIEKRIPFLRWMWTLLIIYWLSGWTIIRGVDHWFFSVWFAFGLFGFVRNLFGVNDEIYTFDKLLGKLTVNQFSILKAKKTTEFSLQNLKETELEVLFRYQFWISYQLKLPIKGSEKAFVLYKGSARALTGRLFSIQLMETVNQFLNPNYKLMK